MATFNRREDSDVYINGDRIEVLFGGGEGVCYAKFMTPDEFIDAGYEPEWADSDASEMWREILRMRKA